MSWHWLIDSRNQDNRVDVPRLLVVLLVCEVVIAPIIWIALDEFPLVFTLTGAAVVSTLLILLDSLLRRRHPRNDT